MQPKVATLSQEQPLHILIADDDFGDRKQIRRSLVKGELRYICTEVSSIKEALETCEKCAFDCAIVDYHLTGEDGLAGITALHERLPYMAIIMITGQGDEIVATEAMKRGASDYISKKNLLPESIRRSIENAVAKARLLKTLAEHRNDLEVFSQVLVHDLRSPLNSILGFATLIEEVNGEKGKSEDIALYSRKVINGVERMAALIDTLSLYTLADGQIPFEPLEMRDVMTDATFNLEHLIRERGARVTYGKLPAVSGTPQLIQLLQNLIGNAIKYCQAEIPSVHVSATPQDGNVWLFSVKDNGIGIPEADYRKVFQPFHRLHANLGYEGTGLGLATCKKIVERHGGTISCESEQGRGTTFFFTLQGAPALAPGRPIPNAISSEDYAASDRRKNSSFEPGSYQAI